MCVCVCVCVCVCACVRERERGVYALCMYHALTMQYLHEEIGRWFLLNLLEDSRNGVSLKSRLVKE